MTKCKCLQHIYHSAENFAHAASDSSASLCHKQNWAPSPLKDYGLPLSHTHYRLHHPTKIQQKLQNNQLQINLAGKLFCLKVSNVLF